MTGSTFCKKCGAAIRFIKMNSGKWHPFNYTTVRVHAGSDEGVFGFETGDFVHSKNLPTDQWGYSSHFSTCPHADKFRKGGKANETKNVRADLD